MKLSIILFAHGEVASNENILCGWINLPLSKKGIVQAEKLSKKLKKEKIDLAFCSDMLRSKQCLVEVLNFHKNAKVIVDLRLRGKHHGLLTGFKHRELKNKSRELFDLVCGSYHFHVDDGESLHHVSKRVFPFMTQVLHLMKKERVNVAISAHPASLRLIMEYLEGLHPKKVADIIHHPEKYKKYVIEFE